MPAASFARLILVALLGLVVAGCMQELAPADSSHLPEPLADAKETNVIWILLDACRGDNLSCMGYDRETSPNIDAIAEDGVVFEHAFSQANATTWSVPSYFTGRYFPVYALDRGPWYELFRRRPDNERYLPEILSDNGYLGHMITTHGWFSSNSRIWRAFDTATYIPPAINEAYATFSAINVEAFEWIKQNHKTPFFLYIHSLDTHFPHDNLRPPYDIWIDPEYKTERLANPSLMTPPFSEEEKRHLRAQHDGSILFADAHIGQLVQLLQYLDIYKNTILIISADHGDLIGEDGQTIDHPSGVSSYELFHVPLILRGPGIPSGLRIPAYVQNADIVPTVIDLLDIESSASMQGKSLLPLLAPDSGTQSLHEFVFAKRPGSAPKSPPIVMLRNPEYHYEIDFGSGTEFLWRMPDRITERRNLVSELPEVADSMRKAAEANIRPFWLQYEQLPLTEYSVVTSKLDPADVPESSSGAWVNNDLHSLDDNKWTLVSGRLKSCSFREDAPPITFNIEIPSGKYQVQIELDGSLGTGEQNGSVVHARAQDDEEFKTLRCEDPNRPRQFVDLGVYAVTTDLFTLTLDDTRDGKWAVAEAVRFVPTTAEIDIEALEGQSERDEQLRSLGYLGD